MRALEEDRNQRKPLLDGEPQLLLAWRGATEGVAEEEDRGHAGQHGPDDRLLPVRTCALGQLLLVRPQLIRCVRPCAPVRPNIAARAERQAGHRIELVPERPDEGVGGVECGRVPPVVGNQQCSLVLGRLQDASLGQPGRT